MEPILPEEGYLKLKGAFDQLDGNDRMIAGQRIATYERAMAQAGLPLLPKATAAKAREREQLEALWLDGEEGWKSYAEKDEALPWANDQERQDFAAIKAMSDMTGVPPSTVGINPDIYRRAIGQSLGKNEPASDEDLRGIFAKQRSERSLFVGSEGARDGALLPSMTKAAAAGQPFEDAWAEWDAISSRHNGAYQPEEREKYLGLARRHYAAEVAQRTKLQPIATKLFGDLRKFTGEEDGSANLAQSAALLEDLTPTEKDKLGVLLREMAEESPSEDDGVAEKIGKAVFRPLRRLQLNLPAGAMEQADNDFRFETEEISMNNRKADKNRQARLEAQRRSDINRLYDIATGVIDPLDKGDAISWSNMLYGGLEAATSMATFAIPYVGPAANIGAYIEEAKVEALDAGASVSTANQMAGVIGGLQGAADRLQLDYLKKLPGFQTLNSGKGLTRYLLQGGATLGAETGIEVVQDPIVPGLVKNAYAGLGVDVEAPEMAEVFQEAWAQVPELAVSMAIPVLLGSGAATARDIKGEIRTREMELNLLAMGYSVEATQSIINAETREAAAGSILDFFGPQERKDGLMTPIEHFAPRDPNSQTAIDARRERIRLIDEGPEMDRAWKNQAGVERVTRGDNGWKIELADGKLLDASSEQAALAIVEELQSAYSLDEARAMVAMEDFLASKGGLNAGEIVSFTGELASADASGITFMKNGAVQRVLEDPRTVEEAMREVELVNRRESGPDGGAMVGIVFGSNALETLGDDVSTLAKIENYQGGTVLTQIHERVESRWKAAIAKGLFSLEESAEIINQVQEATGQVFLEPGKMDETSIREAISEIVVADVLSKRRNGDPVMANSITVALKARIGGLSKSTEVKALRAGEALGKFQSFLRTVRTYFKQVFKLSAALAKARRDGKLEEGGDVDAMIAGLLGLSPTLRLNREVEAEVYEDPAYNPPSETDIDNGVAFSMAPSPFLEHFRHRYSAGGNSFIVGEMMDGERAADSVSDALSADDLEGDLGESLAAGRGAEDILGIPANAKVLVVENLNVDRDRRGQGLGSRMLAKAEADAFAAGAEYSVLWAGTTDDEAGPSGPFYYKQGYTAAYFAPWGDAIMVKKLERKDAAGISFSVAPMKEFLEGSRVVNHDGSPKVVYHGTPDVRGLLGGFTPKFRGEAYFFTDSKRVAKTYADPRRAMDFQNAEPFLVPVYLSFKNPKRIQAAGAHWRNTEAEIEKARAAGFDSIIIYNSRDDYNSRESGAVEDPSTVYVAFSGDQVKAASDETLYSPYDGKEIGRLSFSVGKMFASGLSKAPRDIDLARAMGKSIGIAATYGVGNQYGNGQSVVADTIRDRVIQHVSEGGAAFVDSGAFPDFRAGRGTDFFAVISFYEEMLKRIPVENRRFLNIVAPDVIGDAEATMELQEYFMEDFRRIADLGATIIWPVQTGGQGSLADNAEESIGRLWNYAQEILPQVVIGLPYNAKAWEKEEVLGLIKRWEESSELREMLPDSMTIHLFGGGSKKVAEIEELSGGTEVIINGDSMFKAAAARAFGREFTVVPPVAPPMSQGEMSFSVGSAKMIEDLAADYVAGNPPDRSVVGLRRAADAARARIQEAFDKQAEAKAIPPKERTTLQKALAKANKSQVPVVAGISEADIKLAGTKKLAEIYDLARTSSPTLEIPVKGDRLDYAQGFAPEDREAIASTLAYEVAEALTMDGHASGWYDRTVRRAMSRAKKVFPELKKKENQAVFKAILAITSNGQKVMPQFARSYELFDKWLAGGRGSMPSNGTWGGERAGAMAAHFEALSLLFTLYGLKGTQQFLDSKFTVGQLNKFGNEVLGLPEGKKIISSEAVDTVVQGSMIFGAKLGNFYANMSGDFSAVTMDLWFMRSLGRIIGDIDRADPEKRAGHKKVLVDAMRAEGIPAPRDPAKFDEKARAMLKARNARYTAARGTDVTIESTPLERAVKLYVDGGKLKETPGSGYERRELRILVGMAQEKLRAAGIFLDNADFQAILWYYEKDLVEALGGKKRGKDADYAEAASILEQKFQRSSEYRSDGARSAGGAGRLRPGHFARFSLSSEEAGRVSELGMPLSEEPAGSFAMGSADYLERVATDLAGRRKNPEQRRAAWNRSKRALEDLVLSLDGREDPRIALSRAAISKERKKLQGKLEDDYVEEVWRFYGGALSMTDDLTKATGYPIIAHLMKKAAGLPQGRLMAESKAKKLGDYSKANYDSSRDLPSWLFKGEIAPDQMAQEMHADGLIKEPDVDLMFWSIQEALDSARRSKLQYEEAWAELQSAKRRAKTEALAWEDKAIRALGRDGAKAGAAVVRDAVRGLAAAMVGLPAEVRGKVGGFSRMAGLTTDKAREKFLLETVAKADQALERFMQDEYALQIRKVLEKGMAENKGGEKPKGKIGVEGSRLFAKIAKVVDLSPDEISAAMGNFDKLELDLLGDDSISEEDRRSALADIFDDRRVFDTYGGLFYSDRDGFLRSAAEMDVALTDISEAYTTGRNKWMAVEQARLDDVHEKQDAVVEALGKTSFMGRKRKDQVQKQRLAFLSTLRYSGVSWAQMLDALLGSKHPLAIRWSRKVGEAMGRKTDKLIEQRSRLEQAMKNAMGPGTNSLQAAQRMFDMQTLESINVRKREGSGKSSELVTRKLKESRDRIQSAMDGTLDPAALGVSQAEFELFKAEEERLFMKGSKAKQVTIEVTEEGEVDGTATLTEAQAISLTMLARQEQYKRNLDKWGWDQDAIDDAEAGLSDEGRILRAWLSREYAENYEPLAAVFRRMNGTDLPQILNYSPVQSYHDGIQIEMDAMGGGMMPEGGLRASMLKSRKKHSAELKINSAFSVYYQHVNQSEHFIAFAELTRELRGVFSSQVVQKAVEARLGKEANRKLLAWIDAIQQNGRTNPDKGDAVHKLLGFFQGRVAKIALGAKIGTLLVQSTAAFASVARIGPTAFMRGLAAAMKEPSTFKDFWSSPMIQRRVLAGASPLQRQAMEEHFNARPTRPMVWVEKALELIGTVDGLFTTISGVAAYQYHLDQNLASGMDYDQARRAAMLEAEDVVRRTAQPVELTDKSLIEVDANPIVRFAMLFGSESRKNLALVTEAISQYREGRITAAEMNRALLFVGVISGGLSYLIRSAWWDARDDDDDEIFDDKHWSAMGLMMSMMTAPAQGIPLVRDAISGFSDRGDLEGVMRGIDAAKKLSRAVKEKDLTDQPVEFVEKQIVSILNGAGMLNDRAVPLAVAANLFDQVFKVGDNLFDDSEEAAKKERAAERKEKKEAKEAKE